MLNITENYKNYVSRRLDKGVLFISGPQATVFLQGQLTCDVNHCPTLGGYCTTQGRLISLFYLLKQTFQEQEGYFLECPLEIIDLTMQTLKKYAVFSKVLIKNISDQIPINPIEKIENMDVLILEDILNKIPQLTKKTQNLFLPHHLNLPALGGVSFKKGCYLGQEIIARMEYRGKIKKHLAVFKYEALPAPSLENTALEPGSAIYTPALLMEPVGHIVNISKEYILASVLDEHLEKELRAGDPGGVLLRIVQS